MIEGSIEAVLNEGEYDCGDVVVIDYDELWDLVEQAKFWAEVGRQVGTAWGDLLVQMESRCNRPLHPVLGGKSPYTEFLPI